MGKQICTLLFIGAICLVTFSTAFTTSATDYFYKTYEWDYGGSHWTTTTSIPKDLYNQYNLVSVYERTKNGPAGYGFLVTTQDQYIIGVANSLHNAATKQGYGAYDEVSFVLSFVQSLLYTSDSVSTGYDEYPRFPVETLVDDGGDCEDTSILFATLILILDYDAILINPPNHLAVGVWGSDLYGSYYTYNSKTYYYCETTGNNFRIGDMPSEYTGVSAHLYSIGHGSQYIPNPPTTPNPGQGTTAAPNFSAGLILLMFAGLIVGMIYFSRRATRKQWHTDAAPPPPPPQLLAPSQAAPSTQTTKKKFCRYCGAENKADAVFCEKCGKKIG